jgi:hypothetical protein
MSEQPAGISDAARTAARNLQIDHLTGRVLHAFDAAGVSSLLLKGPSLSRWLYPDGGLRSYVDCDLLVSPTSHAAAVGVLTDLSFTAPFDELEMPEWWREHALSWSHPQDGMIDLHRTLPGVGVHDEVLWSALSAGAEELAVGDATARVLSTPGRALHVALHAAQHGQASEATIRDLDRALEVADDATWRAAAKLAEELRATDALAAGLLLRPAGQALASRLSLPGPQAVQVTLRAASAQSQALTVDQFFRAFGFRARWAIVRHKLLPPPTFMRHWSPAAHHGRWGLWRAYVHRMAWVLARAGPAALAWRRGRRAAKTAAAEKSAAATGTGTSAGQSSEP